MNKEELNNILEEHKKWLLNMGGARAALYGANLCGADLCGADLPGADLRGSDLCGANLCGADLYGANLCGADLSRAALYGANLCGSDLPGADLRGSDLRVADLRGADLYGADLYGADLRGANLRGANLRGAKNINYPINCPEYGSFIGWKKLQGGSIAKLEICEDAKRSSATTRKCRCDKAKVIAIYDGEVESTFGRSTYDSFFEYETGKIVSVDNFDDDRWNECSTGIHFFITRQEAEEY